MFQYKVPVFFIFHKYSQTVLADQKFVLKPHSHTYTQIPFTGWICSPWIIIVFFQGLATDKAASSCGATQHMLTPLVIPQSTVSLKTPIRLWGRSGWSRRDPALDTAFLRFPPCSRDSSAEQVNELRSPQLFRCSRPGLLLGGRGKVCEELPPGCCWGFLGWLGSISDSVNTWKQTGNKCSWHLKYVALNKHVMLL